MSETTNIEWCDSTFNPWTGCTKVSPGCDNCYAEGWAKRSGMVQWGPHAERRRTSAANWKLPLRWNREHEAFLAEHGHRRRVFCASLADVFDNAVPVEWRRDLFDMIRATPNLDWLLVTKRIGNVAGMLAELAAPDSGEHTLIPNMWLGITITSQTEADRDIPKLLHAPAAVRFLSMEPLLGPVDLEREYLSHQCGGRYPFPSLPREYRTTWVNLLDWVIVGGESGPKARPMHPQWVRGLRDQCERSGKPFLFKQWGEWVPRSAGDHRFSDGSSCSTIDPDATRWICISLPEKDRVERNLNGQADDREAEMQKIGKKLAGRLLDGREHNAVPLPALAS